MYHTIPRKLITIVESCRNYNVILLKEYVKPQQTKFLIHPTEECVDEEMTVDLELRPVGSDTLREATLVPPTITVEKQLHHKSTIVPPPSSTGNKKLQGDWATRDRSIFTAPSQQQLPGSRPRSRRGSNASEFEPDGDFFSQQHTWANRVEKTPEKLPIQPQSLAAALEKSKESSPYRNTPTSEMAGQVTPPLSNSKGGVNRRYSYEPSHVKRVSSGDYKRVVSSPSLVTSQGTGRPKSQGFEFSRSGSYNPKSQGSQYSRGGSYNKTPKSYKGPRNYQQSTSGENWSMPRSSTQPVLSASTPDYHRPLQPTAYYRSQSDTKGIHPPTKEHPFTRTEPNNHSGGASGEWTEVRRKSSKSKNHPPSTQGKSNPKDRRQRH